MVMRLDPLGTVEAFLRCTTKQQGAAIERLGSTAILFVCSYYLNVRQMANSAVCMYCAANEANGDLLLDGKKTLPHQFQAAHLRYEEPFALTLLWMSSNWVSQQRPRSVGYRILIIVEYESVA